MVAKGKDSVSMFMNLFGTTFAKICALKIMTLKHLLQKLRIKDLKNIILRVIYRQSNGDVKVSENYFNDFLSKNETNYKKMILVGDFNINVFDFENNRKVEKYLNQKFSRNMIPVINKPTTATKKQRLPLIVSLKIQLQIFLNSKMKLSKQT